MPESGVSSGGGPEYQLPSQETLVLKKALVVTPVSTPLTIIPRFGLFPLVLTTGAGAGAVEGDAAGADAPASTAAEVATALAAGVLEVRAPTGLATTAAEVSATDGDVLELDPAPIGASVKAEFVLGNGALELAAMGEAVADSTGEEVPDSTGSGAWVGTIVPLSAPETVTVTVASAVTVTVACAQELGNGTEAPA